MGGGNGKRGVGGGGVGKRGVGGGGGERGVRCGGGGKRGVWCGVGGVVEGGRCILGCGVTWGRGAIWGLLGSGVCMASC